MKLTQRTPEERQAYVQGYIAAMDAAINRLLSLADEAGGGSGVDGKSYEVAAETLARMKPKGEIVETFEML